MRPKERRETGQKDLFRARLDEIIDMGDPRAKLARTIDWPFLEDRFGAVHSDKAGHPLLPPRLMAGLSILNSMHACRMQSTGRSWSSSPLASIATASGETFVGRGTIRICDRRGACSGD